MTTPQPSTLTWPPCPECGKPLRTFSITAVNQSRTVAYVHSDGSRCSRNLPSASLAPLKP